MVSPNYGMATPIGWEDDINALMKAIARQREIEARSRIWRQRLQREAIFALRRPGIESRIFHCRKVKRGRGPKRIPSRHFHRLARRT